MKAVRLISPVVLAAPLLATVVALAVWAVTLVWASFNPSASVPLSDDTAGANSDVTMEFGIYAPDVSYDTQVSFTPGDPDDPTKGFFVAEGEDIPDGTDVGTLDEAVTLGLLNGPCNTALPVPFDLVDASVDTSDTVTFEEQFQKERHL